MTAAPRFTLGLMRAAEARFRIYGPIDHGDATILEDELQRVRGPVILEINSPGGYAVEGAAMAAAIERHGNVTVYIAGMAASAATLPAIAGRKVYIHDQALMMIHDPSREVFGSAAEIRKAAAGLDKMAETYAAAYARRTKIPVETIREWMIAETWMTAEEAVALRFADEVEAKAQGEPVARADYTAFRNAPEGLRQLTMQSGWTGQPDQKGNDDA
jgi:ATP-dependent Clp protease, protease subunit